MTTARTRPDEEFDGAIAPPTGEWEYELDDFSATFGPGWWPFYKDGRPAPCGLRPKVRQFLDLLTARAADEVICAVARRESWLGCSTKPP